jgi:protein-disulfide isomerase
MNRKFLFISGAGMIFLAFFLAAVLFKDYKSDLQSVAVSQNKNVLERDGAPVKGPADARVTIVEFFDPACGTCREFNPLLKRFIDQYPGKVRVMARYAPLHPGSDQVVKMLEAAHRQGKFWQALTLLFDSQDRWVINHVSQPNLARAILTSLDLDQDKLTADMNRFDLAKAVQQDVLDSQTLNVRATPEFFVNGRPMPSFGYEQLSQLVEDAVAETY